MKSALSLFLPALLWLGALAGSLGASGGVGEAVQTLRLKPVDGMTRAELKYVPDSLAGCRGVLVLCPGWNGDGGRMLRDAAWREFARKHKLAFVGLSFASEKDHDGDAGYHHVDKGSGQLLLDAIERIVPGKLPVVLFGFSRGGQFVHGMASRYPGRVRVWATTGMGPVAELPPGALGKPPGLLVSGMDDPNAGTAREAFFSGIRAKWPVCWLGVPRSGHVIEPRATEWVREFFNAVLSAPPGSAGVWREVTDHGLEGFLVQAWFPSEKLHRAWESFK